MKLADYVGAPIGRLMAAEPFSRWLAKRSIEEGLPAKEVWYEFEGHGVDVICDVDERVMTIFIRRGDGEALSEVPFGLGRRAEIDPLSWTSHDA